MKMKRAEILENAKKCVCGQREQDYGSPEDNFQTIANLWNDYLGAAHKGVVNHCITAKDVSVMMILLKTARIASGTGTDDCFVDIAGYAACGGEIVKENNA